MAIGKRAVVDRDRRVFINCPFDKAYKPLLDAIIFAVHSLGFEARHALIDDGTAIRLTRIVDEIHNARFSIHDMSRVQRTGKLRLPRFNMPFEAGIAYGEHAAATDDHGHDVLLLDSMPYRVNASLSDAAGLDPKIHADKPDRVIDQVRNFLARKSGQNGLPGGAYIAGRYRLFKKLLGKNAADQKVSARELHRLDYLPDLQRLMVEWNQNNPP